ncbi:hypothetical protein EV126DRAFT_70595 [Verticillium dahliae]|nr:hypothetical protein EV126DRAFT_70595 [Verticillium dahliae]
MPANVASGGPSRTQWRLQSALIPNQTWKFPTTRSCTRASTLSITTFLCGKLSAALSGYNGTPGIEPQDTCAKQHWCGGGQLSPCWATQGPSGDSQTNMLVIGSAIVEKVYVLTSHGQHEMHLSRVWRNMVSKVSTQSRTRTALRQASRRKLAGSGIAWRTTVGNQGRFEEAFIRIAPCAPICQSPDGQQIVATVLVPKLEGGESSKGPRLGIGHALVRILVR